MNRTKQPKPPRLAVKLFDWYCSSASADDLRGDIDELFFLDVKRMSIMRASIRYWKHALQLITSYALKKRKQKAALSPFSSNTIHAAMLKNYFLIATRSLARHKFFTIINVLGLAIGMSIGLLFIAMLSFVWRYDTFHTHKDKIYRVVTETYSENRTREYATSPAVLADQLKDHVEGIDEVVRINNTLGGMVSYGTREIPLAGYFVDPNFLTVFSFPLLKGNAGTALNKPNSILITEQAAAKLFGSEDAFGKIITIENLGDCEITGVLKNHPKHSHMHFEILGSYATVLVQQSKTQPEPTINEWKEFRGSYIYMLLDEKTSPNNIEQYLHSVSHEFFSHEVDFKASYSLQSLNDINPGPDYRNQIGPSWDYIGLSIFFVLTLLILIPACFNYANISISRALKRMKEIGLRKVMGGQQDQIFLQFILETIIITFIALGISYYLFTIVRQEFLSMLVAGESAIELTTTIPMVLGFIAFALVVGLAAGAVPAIYFSKLNPIQALKSKSTGVRKGRFNFRKSLIILQFALSLGFIMSVVIVFNQYRQTINYDFGFNQANILDVDLQEANPEIFRNEFSKLSSVQSLSMSSHVMGTESYESAWVLTNDQADSVEVFQMFADYHYLDNLQLKLIAGKNFQENGSSNRKSVIVNEEFLKQFKISNPLDAIGQSFVLTDKQDVIVTGVVKDFHYLSLREPIKSFFFRYDPTQFKIANIKVASTDMFTTISEMESVWKSFGGEKKFEAKFFDDEIEEAYSFYFSMIKICGFLGLLAITISCLGLLGMVVFTVENQVREVGIRKVMGASTTTITLLLSKDFAKLMLIAAMIATPLTYLFFDKVYLSIQYYKVPIGASEIILSLSLILALGLATILSQTLRAARANPVDTLRNE